MTSSDYWKECIALAADECGMALTDEQLECLAAGAEGGHDHYGMAFYSPPSSDRIAAINREADAKIQRLQAEFDKYRENAERAVKGALNVHRDSQVSIGEGGEVSQYGGRIEVIFKPL